MKSTVTRMTIAAALVVVVYFGTDYVRRVGGVTKDIALPETKLETLPMQLGNWKGEDTELDTRIFRKIGAEDVVSRLYRDPLGKEVTLHGAVFGEFVRGVPHSPTVCYPGNGWTKIEQKDVDIEIPNEPAISARAITYDMEGRRILVMFWYQLDDQIFRDNAGLEEARRALRERKEWPAILKVLLQTSVNNPERAEARLVEFASTLYKWTKDLQESHGGPEEPSGQKTEDEQTR